ncbi:MAG TPA: hypothetical protein DCZ03_02105, partial [Gammaproteobacteria bacterium]|nr:hypothetical protein [Gammaproteobacteria bacterium]
MGAVNDNFADYVQQQIRQVDNAELLSFWKQKLESVSALQLAGVKTSGEALPIRRQLTLPDTHWHEIRAYCRQNKITPTIYFRTLYGILIQLICRADEDFMVLEFGAGRNKDHANTIGCYYQQWPFVFDIDLFSAESSVENLYESAKIFQKEAKEYKDFSVFRQLNMLPSEGAIFLFNVYNFVPQYFCLDTDVPVEPLPPDIADRINFVVDLRADGVLL